MSIARTLILRTPGTNCDAETAFAFETAGATAALVSINELVMGTSKLADYQIMAIPGGFSYGDDLGAGKVMANELSLKLCQEVQPFIARGGLVIGICNGFQVLVKAGILPGPVSAGQTVTLANNGSGRFECRWIYLGANPRSKCIFTHGIERMYLPVAHGEGKLVASPEVIDSLDVALYYTDKSGNCQAGYPHNPNGSMNDIGGITDATGRIFALMPHPERHIRGSQNPRWPGEGTREPGDGLAIFKNAVDWVKSL